MPKTYTKAEVVDLVQRAVWLSGTGVYGWNLVWKYLKPLLEEKETNAKRPTSTTLSQ
jgi:hypothetical protein